MKLSLAWIFDHIDADWEKQDINNLISKFNQITAEIEYFTKINIDLSKIFIGQVISQNKKDITTFIPELKKEINLPLRHPSKVTDQENVKNLYFMICIENNKPRWAECKDVKLDKDGLLPSFDIPKNDATENWRKQFENKDIILEIDNKSITHRPDMWGHRGVAREIAAFLDLPFKPKVELLETHNIINFNDKSEQTDDNPFTIEIKAPKACSRFSGLYFKSAENRPSNLLLSSRLIKVGSRPINGIVDLTNYVMLDWSQPTHTYDAEKISNKQLIARMAQSNESLSLLDKQEIKLTNQDLVIADAKKTLGLAGVMGGLHDSITSKTKSIFFESAHFDATPIRRTAIRHKVRTDSAIRFEKTLDPNQITDAILRFLFLAKKINLKIKPAKDIVCVGKPFEEKTIGILHSFLEKRSGTKLQQNEIIESLTKLGFKISHKIEHIDSSQDILYSITIPSYRGAKDVTIKEDVLEEIVRYYGFQKINLELPAIKQEPSDLKPLLKLRKIKSFLAYAAQMTEQHNYIFYDENFLSKIDLNFTNCVEITNPVSENNKLLVTSLIPNLFKNITKNIQENRLRFFECGKTWKLENKKIFEKYSLAGLFFEKKEKIDFYKYKQYLLDLLNVCKITNTTWKKIDNHLQKSPWVMPYQSAEIFHDNSKIGIAGKVDLAFLNKLGMLPESDCFFFELDRERLTHYHIEQTPYCPISKYQGTTFDLCFTVPLTLTTNTLEKSLLDSDDFIEKIELIDFFEKEDWTDKRSVAFRLWVSNPEKTLTKSEIDKTRENAIQAAKNLDAYLRE